MTTAIKLTRELIQESYIRICEDLDFSWDCTRVAIFLAEILNIHPLQILEAMGTLENMSKISDGTHPYLESRKKSNASATQEL